MTLDRKSQVMLEPRSNMAASCAASEVAVFARAGEQHHQPRGSSASLGAGVSSHFESCLCCDWSKFRSIALLFLTNKMQTPSTLTWRITIALFFNTVCQYLYLLFTLSLTKKERFCGMPYTAFFRSHHRFFGGIELFLHLCWRAACSSNISRKNYCLCSTPQRFLFMENI